MIKATATAKEPTEAVEPVAEVAQAAAAVTAMVAQDGTQALKKKSNKYTINQPLTTKKRYILLKIVPFFIRNFADFILKEDRV